MQECRRESAIWHLVELDSRLLEASLKLAGDASVITEPTVIMTMLLKIEPIVDYSYFILVFQFRGSVWFATDFIEFSNPRVATCSRNPRRRSRDREDAIPFPYGLIDDVIEWRKNASLPTKAGEGVPEIYAKKLREYLPFGSRVHLRILIDGLMQRIVQGGFDFPALNQFVNLVANNPKLIGEGSFDESKFSKTNYESMKSYVDQLVIPGQTTLPVLTSQALLASSSFAPHTLMTQEDFERNVAWFKYEEIRKTKQELLDDYYRDHSASDIDEMRKLLYDNRKAIYELITIANTLYFYDKDNIVSQGFGMFGAARFPQLFSNFQPHYWYNYFTVSYIYARENYCVECHRFKTKNQVIRFSISTFEELTLLTGKTREELPKTFANFLQHFYIPYYGNSILDNVNPEFLIKDPLSSKFPNGFTFELHVCGKCLRHYLHKNKKFDKAAVIWSSKEHKIVDIVEHSVLVNKIKEMQQQTAQG